MFVDCSHKVAVIVMSRSTCSRWWCR